MKLLIVGPRPAMADGRIERAAERIRGSGKAEVTTPDGIDFKRLDKRVKSDRFREVPALLEPRFDGLVVLPTGDQLVVPMVSRGVYFYVAAFLRAGKPVFAVGGGEMVKVVGVELLDGRDEKGAWATRYAELRLRRKTG